jgi:hypothetical protein
MMDILEDPIMAEEDFLTLEEMILEDDIIESEFESIDEISVQKQLNLQQNHQQKALRDRVVIYLRIKGLH